MTALDQSKIYLSRESTMVSGFISIQHTMVNSLAPVASFTKEVNPRLAKRPLVFNGCIVNRGLTSLVKEATGRYVSNSKF